MFQRIMGFFKEKDPLIELNRAGDRDYEIIRVWQKYGSAVLESLPLEADPDFCLDGVHLFYSKYSHPYSLEEIIILISDHYQEGLSSAASVKFSVNMVRDRVKDSTLILHVSCEKQFSDHSHGELTLRMIKTGENEFRGCTCSNEAVWGLKES